MNLSVDNTRFLVTAVLVVHGLGHGGALVALLWTRMFPGSPTGAWLAARSWLFPALRSGDATNVALAFWAIAMIGFVLAALAFWGVVMPVDAWRVLAVGSAVVSLTGMFLFFGIWPAFNWTASLVVNLGILATQLLTRWPPAEVVP